MSTETGLPNGEALRPSSPGDSAESRIAVLRSEDLLAGRSEVWIEHRGDMYRLRLTASGKLYLTK
jgi:hemin uptake protein HemP